MLVGTTRRHSELLDGLVTLFLAQGFQRFTLGDLAQKMHCSKTTLYALGHSKEALVRNVLATFFRAAGEEVERSTALAADPEGKIVAYLRAVADELRPASPRFFADVASNPDARSVYERNTRIAATRVAQLITAGAQSGAFRAVDPTFVADMVATQMTRIQSDEVSVCTGLSHAEAYDELAHVVLKGISR